ncbi:MAG TPA: TonB-dependent receptor [Chitinophagaceae bacterium]|nr:TonB-dependent receptor [Chitinophagaceae bacterium]
MNRIYLLLLALVCAGTVSAQYTAKIKVINADTKEPIPGVTVWVAGMNNAKATDSAGVVTLLVERTGNMKLIVSHVSFLDAEFPMDVPLKREYFEVEMKPEEEEEEEVIVQSTRTSRSIQNVPTRVETIELEEIDEKSNMRPGNVSMLLHESTGIQVQQTSATSGNASIRLQGLDGRYTQLLKDGFASFGNFASGLSVLEIPPLDLKQVEIIKGPVSPLFGGGAIAGVVNFISKTPKEKPENSFVLNQSNIGQTNFGFFSSKKSKKTGYTFLGLVGNQKLFDVDKDDFTEVPESFEFTLHPKLFIYPNEKTTFIIGNSFTKGKRTGGDVQVIKGKADATHRYFEENNTVRNITTFELQKKFDDKESMTIKQSLSIFDRHIEIPAYHFDGISYNSFTDLSFLKNSAKHSLVTGVNVVYDYFDEKNQSAGNRDNKSITGGAYIQDTWDASPVIKLESGLRFDYAHYSNRIFDNEEIFVLPRVSLLVKYNNKLSSRIGAGMGYKLPTLFTEQTETIQYQDVLQLTNVKSERSYGGTADINFKTKIGHDFDLSFNHMFYYTWIDRPLVLQSGLPGLSFVNAGKPVQSKGFETNAKFIFKHNFKLFLGYTFTDAQAKYLAGNQFLPLVPKHKFNSALIYEKHEFLKLGLEGYYTSSQFLYNGSKTADFWEFGFMAEKLWKKFSLYINFENFTDTRQSNYKRVANDPHSNPSFDDIWTHTEGFVINGGIKIKL